MVKYGPLYIRFLVYFNHERDYFECHEVMEELWLEEGRHPVWQGLLQVAVGLYHHRNGNVNGAIKLFQQALAKLDGLPEIYQGIRMGQLVRDSKAYLAGLLRADREPFPFHDLTIGIEDPELARLVHEAAQDPALLEDDRL